MKKISIVLLICCFAGQAYAYTSKHKTPEHYCDNAREWQQWQNLVDKYLDDDNLATTYALRIGLCQQIKAGTIETGRAISIFDHFFEILKGITLENQRREMLKSKKVNT